MNNEIIYKRLFRICSLAGIFLTLLFLPLSGWSITVLTENSPIPSQSARELNDPQPKDKCSIIYLKYGDSIRVSSFKNSKGRLRYVPCDSPVDSFRYISYTDLLAVQNSKGKIIFTNDAEKFPGARTNFYLMGLTSGLLTFAPLLGLLMPSPIGVIFACTALFSGFVLGIIANGKMKKYQQRKGKAWADISVVIGILFLVGGLLALLGAGIYM